MSTFAHHTWTCLQILNVTYAAVRVLILIMFHLFFGAFLLQTRQTFFLTNIAIAGMLTRMYFRASISCYFFALFFWTYVMKCGNSYVTGIATLQRLSAISTFLWIFKLLILCTSFAKMIRSWLTEPALLLLAYRVRTNESIFGIVFS